MLIWVLIGLGVVIVAARSIFGHKVALALVALWIVVALVGWITETGFRT